jgi:hypothetical protein
VTREQCRFAFQGIATGYGKSAQCACDAQLQRSEAIRAHAEFAESSIQHKIIITESVAKLRAEFEVSRTPLPSMRKI